MFGFEPLILIGPPLPILFSIGRALLFEGDGSGFSPPESEGHGSAEGGAGFASGYASVVSQKRNGAVHAAASQVSA